MLLSGKEAGDEQLLSIPDRVGAAGAAGASRDVRGVVMNSAMKRMSGSNRFFHDNGRADDGTIIAPF